MDSRAVLQRFEQEREALALMDHPNIARVLDGGLTPSGQPFFVMELVNGLPLTSFATKPGSLRGSGSRSSCRSATPCSTPIRRASSIAT
jgi:serine/threonine protein kinase